MDLKYFICLIKILLLIILKYIFSFIIIVCVLNIYTDISYFLSTGILFLYFMCVKLMVLYCSAIIIYLIDIHYDRIR
jgi:hypothetical protein